MAMEQNKEVLLACCGLDCVECPARKAWLADDEGLRRTVAAEWSAQFGVRIPWESINCAGCLSTWGPKFSHCTECGIRACATNRNLSHCGMCEEMDGCDKVQQVLDHAPGARERLVAARQS